MENPICSPVIRNNEVTQDKSKYTETTRYEINLTKLAAPIKLPR